MASKTNSDNGSLSPEQSVPDYIGKRLILDGHEYVVGPRRSAGRFTVTHELVNTSTSIGVNFVRFFPGSGTGIAHERALYQHFGDTGHVPLAFAAELDGVACHVQDREAPFAGVEVLPMQERFANAAELLRNGALQEARQALTEIVRQCPKHSVALYNLGWTYRKMGHREAALSCQADVMKLEPHWAACMTEALLMASEDRVWTSARDLLGRLHARYPSYASWDEDAHWVYMVHEPYLALAIAMYREANSDDQRLIYRKRQMEAELAVKRLNEARALLTYANLLSSDEERARELEQAKELFPTCPFITANLALILGRLRRSQDAITQFKEAFSLQRGLHQAVCCANALCIAAGAGPDPYIDLFAEGLLNWLEQAPPTTRHELPGIALWFDPNGRIALELDSQRDVLERLVRMAATRPPSWPALQQIISIYERTP